MPCCCVDKCNNRSETKNKENDGITFHLFPRNTAKRKNWVDAISRQNWTPSTSSVVCSQHFKKTCFYKTKSGLTRLHNDAIPSISNLHEICVEENVEAVENDESPVSLEFPVLKLPLVKNSDGLKVKLIATHIRKLLHVCKKQRKDIKMLKKKLRKQELILNNGRFTNIDVDMKENVNET